MKLPFLPEEASDMAAQVDLLYFGLTLISALVILLILIPMVYFLFKYRRGKKADRRLLPVPTVRIEIAWTLVPLLIMMGMFSWAAMLYYDIQRPPPGAMEIFVVGKQWMWKLQHPEGNREINELHVPAGRVIKLTLTSQDVIHSFFVPAFRVKQDVLPGRYTTLWFKARKTGTYHLFCTEYCGTQHSGMIGRVIVMDPAAYEAWLIDGQPDQSMVQSGERLYRDLGCSGCHAGSTIVRAPPLEGLFGRPVPIQDGGVITADEAYIRDSILLPARQIAAGYANQMPSFEGRLSEEELMQLIAYIRDLGSQPPIQFNPVEGSP